MSLEPGSRLLHYTLTEKIGEGGMGAVWRATDTTLNRDVAIKLLPQVFAESPERLARFEREAQLLASLNHPNIAAIYGLHEAETSTGALRFIVMELVPGQDLAQRLARGALPVGDALEVARQAHRAAAERIPQARSWPDPVLSYGYFAEEVETALGPQEHRIGLSQREALRRLEVEHVV